MTAIADDGLVPGGAGLVLPPPLLADWAARAEPGARRVYARGLHLPPAAATLALVRQLHDDGALLLVQRRGAHGFDWIAQRTRGGLPPAAKLAAAGSGAAAGGAPGRKPRAARLPDIPEDRPEAQRLYDWLKRCANFGLACPSNAEVARRLGVSTDVARGLFDFLGARGLIEMSWPARTARVVRIVRTGRRTACVAAGRAGGAGGMLSAETARRAEDWIGALIAASAAAHARPSVETAARLAAVLQQQPPAGVSTAWSPVVERARHWLELADGRVARQPFDFAVLDQALENAPLVPTHTWQQRKDLA